MLQFMFYQIQILRGKKINIMQIYCALGGTEPYFMVRLLNSLIHQKISTEFKKNDFFSMWHDNYIIWI